MCHSDKTTKKWYIRQSLTEGAAQAAEQIKEHTRPTRKPPAPSQKQEDDTSDDTHPLTAEEQTAIKDVFQSSIKRNEDLTKEQLMSKMSDSAVLSQCLKSPHLIKKVGDRYRYKIRSKRITSQREREADL